MFTKNARIDYILVTSKTVTQGVLKNNNTKCCSLFLTVSIQDNDKNNYKLKNVNTV